MNGEQIFNQAVARAKDLTLFYRDEVEFFRYRPGCDAVEAIDADNGLVVVSLRPSSLQVMNRSKQEIQAEIFRQVADYQQQRALFNGILRVCL